jgi:hypothetical protein
VQLARGELLRRSRPSSALGGLPDWGCLSEDCSSPLLCGVRAEARDKQGSKGACLRATLVPLASGEVASTSRFVAVDVPENSVLLVGVLATVAQHEAELISHRTRSPPCRCESPRRTAGRLVAVHCRRSAEGRL